MEEALQHQTTPQCSGLSPAGSPSHHNDGPKADHALTFNLEHSRGAAHLRGIAREMAYTGRNVTASEAKSRGLLNRVYPDQEIMLAGVIEIAAEIASKAPLAVYGCKKMIIYSRDHSTQDALDYVAIWSATHFKLTEILEAMEARKANRPGRFASLQKQRI